jgi:hypothetical protein
MNRVLHTPERAIPLHFLKPRSPHLQIPSIIIPMDSSQKASIYAPKDSIARLLTQIALNFFFSF